MSDVQKINPAVRAGTSLFPLPPWALLTLAALLLRLWGLWSGLPDVTHPDENMVVRRALRFGTGDLNPHFFYYPSLSIYLFFLLDGLYFLLGRTTGLFTSVMDFGVHFVRNPAAVYLLARLSTATADAISAGLLFIIGRQHWGEEVGWYAGILWTLFPLAIQECQVAKPDSLMLCLSLASIALLGRESPGSSLKSSLAGFLLGLGISAKYNAALLVPGFIIGFWRHEWAQKRKNGGLAKFLLSAGGGFLAGTPFALLDMKKFIHDFMEQSNIMRTGIPGLRPRAGIFHYLGLLINPLHSPIVGALFIYGLWNITLKTKRALLWLPTMLLTILMVLGTRRIYGTHYFYIGFPFLFLLAARGLEQLSQGFKILQQRARLIATVLFITASTPYALATSRYLWTIGHKDTRVLAHEWIVRNIPQNSAILMDASGPTLWMTKPQLENLYERARRANHIKADLFALQILAHPGGGYRLFLTEQPMMVTPPDLLSYSRSVQNLIPIDQGLSGVRQQGIQYVITSGESETYQDPQIRKVYPKHAKFYEDLTKQGLLLVKFSPVNRPGSPIKIFQIQ